MSPDRPPHRILPLALALGLLLGGAPALRAGEADDLEALKKELGRIEADLAKTGAILSELERKSREEYKAKGYACFLDQSHWVKTSFLKPGWTVPMTPKVSVFGKVLPDGLQAAGTWESGKPGEPTKVVAARVLRFAHLVPGSDPPQAAKTKVDPEGEPIPHSDPLRLLKEMHRLAMAELEPPPEPPPAPPAGKPAPEMDPALALRIKDAKACQAPAKKSLGVTRWFAAVQGTLKGTGVRTRREWYAWSGKDSVYKGRDVTWILAVRYDESALGNNGQLALGRDFAEAIATY